MENNQQGAQAQTIQIEPDAQIMLMGRRIIRIDADAIHLDNGYAIHLSDDEIVRLNEKFPPLENAD